MTTTLFDHHIHSDRSDGRVALADRAKSVSVRPHGISDHFPWPGKMQTDDDVLRYLDEAASLGLRVGIEYDLGAAPPLRPSTRDALHYVIGAIHQVTIDGQRVGYDRAGQFLKGLRPGPYLELERFSDPSLQRAVLDRVLALVREGIDDVGIDVLGHPTLSPLAALGDPESSFPAEWQDRIIALCVDSSVALELNESYGVPHHGFLVRARDAGARFSVGSDSHGELLPLDRTLRMIADASLPAERFMNGERIRRGRASPARAARPQDAEQPR